MNEFFQSIISWVFENKEGILATLTSGTFISTIWTIFVNLRTRRKYSENIDAVNSLNVVVSKSKTSVDTISKIEDDVEVTHKLLCSFKDDLGLLEERVEELVSKLNAVIEVQSVVYSTVRDDEVRNTVANILNSAKHFTSCNTASLRAQIKEFKEKLEEQKKLNSDMQKALDTNMQEAEAETVNESAEKLMRY